MTTIIGLLALYSVVHFFFIQKKAYKARTQYEKIVTWCAIAFISLIFIDIMNS